MQLYVTDVNVQAKKTLGGALYQQSFLAAKQIALFRFKRLCNKHQHADNQIGGEDPDQPLRHFQRQNSHWRTEQSPVATNT